MTQKVAQAIDERRDAAKVMREELAATRKMMKEANSGIEAMREAMKVHSSMGKHFLEDFHAQQEHWDAVRKSLEIDTTWIREFREEQERLAKSMKTAFEPMFSGADFSSLIEGAFESQSLLADANKALLESIRIPDSLFAEIRSAATELPKLLGSIPNISSDLLQRTVLDVESMKETGWWRVDELIDKLPYSTYADALSLEATEGRFSELLSRVLRADDCAKTKALLERWRKYDFLEEKRMTILQHAVEAHMDDKYTLSIPVLMIQIDYFSKYVLSEKQEIFRKRKPAEIPEASYFHIMHLHTARFFYTNILFISEDDRKKLSDTKRAEIERINRHAVLHGENVEYPHEHRSTKLILFLDKIFRLIDEDAEIWREIDS